MSLSPCLVLLMSVTSQVPADDADPRTVKPERVWAGSLRDEPLRTAAPPGGLIADAASFDRVWEAWRPGERTPEIDFDARFVAVGTVPGPNRMFAAASQTGGDLRVTFGGTKVAGPGFAYLMALLPRAGVDRVNGRPLPEPELHLSEQDAAGPRREFARVLLQGTLEAGVVAVGGETTGVLLRADGMTFELILPEEIRSTAPALNGRLVRLTGDLSVKAGLERGPRWLVTVERLATREEPPPAASISPEPTADEEE